MGATAAKIPIWALLTAYWLVQPVVLMVLLCLFILTAPRDWLYGPPDLSVLKDALTEPRFYLWVGIVSGAITVAQALFLLPVRKPGLSGGSGRSVRLTLIVGGLAWALLSFGLIATLLTLAGHYGLFDALTRASPLLDRLQSTIVMTVLGVSALACWIVPTVLLFVFTRPSPREGVVSRVANRLLLGTAAEALLVIPADVMIRRKTECYCGDGSFWALIFMGVVGSLAAGPAAILPLFASRRRHWYRSHCNACGYDMSGSLDADRCPECGKAWIAPKP